jgi:aryl-alcohol dehydrogenase-like predicted oxidoreductase
VLRHSIHSVAQHSNGRKTVAGREGATPAQIALAWLLAQKPWIASIPGTIKLHRLDENLGAVSIDLSAEDLAESYKEISSIKVEGKRLPEALLKMTGH